MGNIRMTINEALRIGTGILKNAGNEAPANDAGVLLCYTLKCDRVFLFAHGAEQLEDSALKVFESLAEKRADGVPLQYLTGFQEFMSLPFEVGQGVLIPRQDTEILVEMVIKLCRKNFGGSADILDIGTGSGCIAVSLAHYSPGCRVTAVDKMPEALDIAKRNAAKNGVESRVRFIKSDLFDEIAGERYNIIVSNPPYIRTDEIRTLDREVRCYEPVTALDGGSDGLMFYRAIIKDAPVFLKEQGILAFETGYDQASDVKELMNESFHDVRIYKDLSGIDRAVIGRVQYPADNIYVV